MKKIRIIEMRGEIMSELNIRGLSDFQLERLLNGRANRMEISYVVINTVLYVRTGEKSGRVLFDNMPEWNFNFPGDADDLLRVLSGGVK